MPAITKYCTLWGISWNLGIISHLHIEPCLDFHKGYDIVTQPSGYGRQVPRSLTVSNRVAWLEFCCSSWSSELAIVTYRYFCMQIRCDLHWLSIQSRVQYNLQLHNKHLFFSKWPRKMAAKWSSSAQYTSEWLPSKTVIFARRTQIRHPSILDYCVSTIRSIEVSP